MQAGDTGETREVYKASGNRYDRFEMDTIHRQGLGEYK